MDAKSGIHESKASINDALFGTLKKDGDHDGKNGKWSSLNVDYFFLARSKKCKNDDFLNNFLGSGFENLRHHKSQLGSCFRKRKKV